MPQGNDQHEHHPTTMEKVHFQLESTLPELRDLEEKGLFTRAELRQITLRRTKHESDLVKRAGKPEDYLKYAEYEIGLERLRRIRWKRLSRWLSRLWAGISARQQILTKSHMLSLTFLLCPDNNLPMCHLQRWTNLTNPDPSPPTPSPVESSTSSVARQKSSLGTCGRGWPTSITPRARAWARSSSTR